MHIKKVVVLSGAGISAESGLKTFRDSNGLWEEFKIEEVASIEGWKANPKKVLDFYNARRIQAQKAQPNRAHQFFAELEKDYDLTIITQNVDDLHERGGSSDVLHLHGTLNHYKCTQGCHHGALKNDLNLASKCPSGYQLRPDIVWFGEEVPAYAKAIELVRKCDLLIIVGTSLQVYPAANLAFQAERASQIILIDPHAQDLATQGLENLHIIKSKATDALEELSLILS
ncbi:MAG: SIR2 family NAD-dependent protein deacylase [Flavobacteriaceae bacterium]